MDYEDKRTIKTMNESNPRISVIMGIYNCADTLIEALESLEAQTYKRFKVILCDDGSKDNTLEVALKWAESHANYIVIKNEKNIKLAATLNHCLDYADTEYVARMDGDDISTPDRFEKEISFLDSHPEYALVSCGMIYFDEKGEYGKNYPKIEPTRFDFKYSSPFCHAPVMMRRDILEKIGRYTANELTVRVEDYYLWYKFYKAGYKGYNLNMYLYKMLNGRDAYKRRRIADRWHAAKTNYLVNKGLGVPNAWFYAFVAIAKGLFPTFLIKLYHKYTLR